jgi:hypothetical protein
VIATSTSTHAPTTTTTAVRYIDPGICCVFHGQAVDPQGHPLAGIYVYEGMPSGSAPTKVTDADGRYTGWCAPTDPYGTFTSTVVLSGPLLDGFVSDHRADQNWVPTRVVTPDGGPWSKWCVGTDPIPGTVVPPSIVTTLPVGGIITGAYDDPYNPPYTYVGLPEGGTTASVLVEIAALPFDGESACAPFCAYLEGLVMSDQQYTIVGVPPGVHRMGYFNGAGDGYPSVTVVAGHTTHADLTAPKPGPVDPVP